MPGITSLIVKIGAQDAEITAALTKLGSNVKRTSDELKKLGSSPVAQQAQQSLNTLNETVKQVQNSQSRLADRAKLAAAGLESMGGPAKLTARELDQVNKIIQQGLDAYRALGQQAPKELQKVADAVAKQQKQLADSGKGGGALGGTKDLLGAFGIGTGLLTTAGVVGALGAGAKAAFDYADGLTKMSDKTGIAIEALQRLEAVAAPSGNTLEQVTSAVNQFQKRIAEGSTETVDAVSRIGLTVSQLRALSPDEQFFAIAKGIQTIKDPAEQTRLAMELFGRSGAELLPTLKADVDTLKDSTIKMSAESAQALDELGDAFTRWKGNAVAAIGDVLGQILRMRTEGGPGLAVILALNPNLGANIVANTVATNVNQRVFSNGQLPSARPTSDVRLGAAPGAFQLSVSATQAQIELETGLAEAVKKSEAAVKAANQAEREHAQALRASAEASRAMIIQQSSLVAIMERRLRAGGVVLTEQFDALPVTPSRRVESALFANLRPGPNATLAALSTGFGQNFSETLRTSLPQAILSAIQGGGSVFRSAGSTLGSFLTSEGGFGKTLTGGLTSIFGQGLGSAISSLLPGVGALLGPLLGAISDKLKLGAISDKLKEVFGGPDRQEREGRAAQAQFQGRFGSFEDMVNRLGDAYARVTGNRADAQAAVKAMLDAETQGAEAVRREIERLQGVLDRADRIRQGEAQFGPSQSELRAAAQDAKDVYEDMLRQARESGEFTDEQVNASYVAWQRAMAAAGNEAAQAWVTAHDRAEEGIAGPVSALQSQIQQLRQSIANEAPEAVKGVIETQVEGQIAALESQMTAAQDALADHAGASATEATQAIADVFDGFEAHVQVVYDYPDNGPAGTQSVAVPVSRGGLVVPGGVQYLATGGTVLPFLRRGTDTVPAMLTPGEIVLNAAQQGRIASALSGVGASANMTVVLESEGRTLAEVVVPFIPGVLKRYRVA